MEIEGGICSLCLENCENFKVIDGNTENILNILLLKIDFTAITEPLICKNCEEMLIKCFDFKSTCLTTQNYLVPILSNSDNAKLDIKDAYLSRNITDIGVPEDHVICGLCMGMVNNCSAVSLDVEEEVEQKGFMLEKMIEQCLPELDLNIIKKPVMCASCHGSLKDYFHFVMNHLLVMKRNCATPDINSKDQIELAIKSETTGDVDGNWTDIKLENTFFDDNEGANMDVENEFKSFMGPDDQEVNNEQCSSKNISTLAVDGNKLSMVKIEEPFYVEGNPEHEEENFVDGDQNFVFNGDSNRLEHDIVLPQSQTPGRLHGSEKNVSNIKMFKCDFCSYQTKYKHSLNIHLITHQNPSEVIMHKCDFCSFQSKHRHCLKRHLTLHKNPSEMTMHKCDSCSYQTHRKEHLKNHMLKHKDPSEVTTYRCDSCSYRTVHKSVIKRHSLVHKDPLEITMHKCDHCPYQTKHKDNFKKHSRIHKDSSEVTTHKCDSCSFQTKDEHTPDYHMSTQPSKIAKYTCDTCSFQTDQDACLKNHLLSHTSPSEETMYKCEFCSYQNKHKGVLRKHLLRHKDPSEVTLYKCDYCSYQTRYKACFTSHLIKHKGPSEVTMYKCETCSFETKRRESLRSHLLMHKDPSEATVYTCDYCSFQTIRKNSVRNHMLLHTNPEATVYKCDTCSYQTKIKYYFKRHLLSHKEPAEDKMLKCASCSFKTLRKSTLQTHVLKHQRGF